MSLIIAATDFSDVAQNAVKYACTLASAQKADVLILHSYIVPVMFSDVPMPSSVINDAQTDAEDQMKTLVKDMSASFQDIEVKGSVVYGDTIDILDEYEAHKKPMLIIVGNSSTPDNTTWLDNTLHEEFKKLKRPVLAVPPHSAYKPIQKICFAFDNKHTGNDIALQQLIDLATTVNAELHVLTTLADAHNQDSNADIDAAAKNQLSSANAQYHIVYGVQDTDKAIQDFVTNNNIDWLVMIPRKHSFFEGLFHKSHTKNIAQNIHVPIVALHEK